MENDNNIGEQNYKPNSRLFYTYTESAIKLLNDSINALNSKLSTVIGFAGVLLRFGVDLPGNIPIGDTQCLSCLILKVASITFAFLSILTAILGFLPQTVGTMAYPEDLLVDEYFEDTEENNRIRIVKTWLIGYQLILDSIDTKSAGLKHASIFLLFAAAAYALDSVIASIFK
jgi:hypothetical protein